MKRMTTYLCLAWVLAAAGCLHNDIPYPVVECRIESIEAEGLSGAAVIDAAAGTVTLPLLETTDIRNVRITEAVITDKARSSHEIEGTHDLSNPLLVVLSLYADYPWTITAQQNIPRQFAVEGQVGVTEWDYALRTATAYVGYDGSGDMPEYGPSKVRVQALKLGPAGITSMNVPAEGIDDFEERDPEQEWNFSSYRNVNISFHGREEQWTLYVRYTDTKVVLRRVDGWTRTAWFYGEGLSGTTLGFRYRRTGEEAWTEVPSSEITVDGGSFTAQIHGLEPETDYEAVAWSDSDDSAVTAFRTEAEMPLPNGGFEDWSQQGNVLCPYLGTSDKFWDSGNWGATTLGPEYNITTNVTNDLHAGTSGRTAARMASRWVVMKFAAGNIFTGEYFKTEGTHGRVNFGRRFTLHPTALRGWTKFDNGKINRGELPKGVTAEYDEGQIYIALGTWKAADFGGSDESPVQVYSKDEKTFFDKNKPEVVAYGEKIYTQPTDGWEPFEIPITWKSSDAVPTHIIIVCSASRWGDYFVGCDSNVMLVDDFELVWDGEVEIGKW